MNEDLDFIEVRSPRTKRWYREARKIVFEETSNPKDNLTGNERGHMNKITMSQMSLSIVNRNDQSLKPSLYKKGVEALILGYEIQYRCCIPKWATTNPRVENILVSTYDHSDALQVFRTLSQDHRGAIADVLARECYRKVIIPKSRRIEHDHDWHLSHEYKEYALEKLQEIYHLLVPYSDE